MSQTSGSAPGEPLRAAPDAPGVPRLAASVILLRGAAAGLEVLLVRRTPQARFMAGAWVFPGGAVERGDGDGDAALRAAAIRETREEAAIKLPGPGALVPFSRWITPRELAIRFDTHFFLAPLPARQEPAVDGQEIVDLGWFTPAGALAASRAGTLDLVYPTVKHLEQLTSFDSAEALLAHAAAHDVVAVEPRVVGSGETARVLLPGDPGHDAA